VIKKRAPSTETSRDPYYWLSRTVEERFAALEALNREHHGDEAMDAPMRKDIVRVIRLDKK
jgi:hypothetical protein